GIMVIAKRTEGNKVGGILAIVGGVIAGFAWIPLVAGLVLFGLSASGSSVLEPSVSASEDADVSEEPDASDSDAPSEATGAHDADAYLAEVRPQLEQLMGEIDPVFTP